MAEVKGKEGKFYILSTERPYLLNDGLYLVRCILPFTHLLVRLLSDFTIGRRSLKLDL